MRKLIFLFVVFLFLTPQVSKAYTGRYDAQLKKMAENEVKDYLHDKLEEKLGSDIPVENILQAIDHLAHGEPQKANMVAGEELASQFVSLLVGSEGGAIIGAGWSFAKYSYTSVVKWADSMEWKKFINEFLNPQIESWKKAKRVPPWRDVVRLFNLWFDDHPNLGITHFRTERKKYREALKSKAWAKTLEVHTAYRKYFDNLRKTQLACRLAIQKYLLMVSKRYEKLKKIADTLHKANEKVSKANMERFEKNKNYRLIVIKTAAINSVLPKKQWITTKELAQTIKKLKGLKAKQIKLISQKLAEGGFVPDIQSIRMFAISKAFREKVEKAIEENRKKAPPFKFQPPEDKQIGSIANSIADIKPVDFVEISSLSSADFSKELSQALKTAISKTQVKAQRKEKQLLYLEPFKQLHKKITNQYLNAAISFYSFVSMHNLILSVSNQYISRVVSFSFSQKDRDAIKRFANSINQDSSIVRNARLTAQKKIEELKNRIFETDKEMIDFRNAQIRKIREKIKRKPYTKSDLEWIEYDYELKSPIATRLRYPITLKKIHDLAKGYENIAGSLNTEIEAKQEALSAIEKRMKDYETDVEWLNNKLKETKEELSCLTEEYPYTEQNNYQYLKQCNYKDKRVYSPTRQPLNVKKILNSTIEYLENTIFFGQIIKSKLLDGATFLKVQEKFNKDIMFISSVNLNKFKETIAKNAGYLNNISDSCGTLKGSIATLNYKYRENLEFLNSRSSSLSMDERVKEIEKNRDGRLYIPLSSYQNRLDAVKKMLRQCNTRFKAAEEAAKEVEKYAALTSRFASQIKIWSEEAKHAYSRFKTKISDALYNKPNSNPCKELKEDIATIQKGLNNLKSIEVEILSKIKQYKDADFYEFREVLYKAIALPFKPSFNIEYYKRHLAKKEKELYVVTVDLKQIYINGQKTFRAITLTPNNIRNGRIKISGKFELSPPQFARLLKYIKMKYEGGTRYCDVKKNSFSCFIKAPSNNTTYTLLFYAKSEHTKDEQYLGFRFITFKKRMTEVDRCLNNFLNTYNKDGNIDRFFPRGSYTTDVWVKSYRANRKTPHTLIFYPQSVVKFRYFEGGSTAWQTVVNVPWRIKGKINKKGVAVMTIIKQRPLLPTEKTKFIITNIEGDSFLTPFKNPKQPETSGKVRVAILSHHFSGNASFGYSLDFETGKYTGKEADIAAGYVNPKVKEASKPYFNVGFIKDMGAVSLDSVKRCPKSGYGNQYDYTRAIVGHTYCVRTQEGHYAKIYVEKTGGTAEKAYIKFEWVYSNTNRFK